MNPEFEKALAKGNVEPVILPDGTAFIRDEITFYQATQNGIALYKSRFHSFGDALRKRDTLKITSEMMDAAYSTKKELLKIALMNMQSNPVQAQDAIREVLTIDDRINQRRNFGLDVDQVYEIASIWYFTQDEDPAWIEKKSNAEKIAIWWKYPELYSFFLHTPMGRFVPLDSLIKDDILGYIQELNLVEKLDWNRILMQLKGFGVNGSTESLIESRLATLQAYDNLIELLSKGSAPR